MNDQLEYLPHITCICSDFPLLFSLPPPLLLQKVRNASFSALFYTSGIVLILAWQPGVDSGDINQVGALALYSKAIQAKNFNVLYFKFLFHFCPFNL